MKLLLFSDLHAHTYREFAYPPLDPVNLNSRLEYCLSVLDRIREYARTHMIENVLFAGDLFDKRNVIQTAMYNLIFNSVALFREDEIDLFLIPGNHDQTTVDGTVHSLYPMQAVARVIDQPSNIKIGDALVRFVPYMDDAKELKKAISLVPKNSKGPILLVAHAGLSGAVTGPVEYQPEEELSPREDVPNAYDFAFFGHYHKRQMMRERCWYIGSPMQQNRGERENHDKGFIVFNTETLKYKNIPLGMPEFVTVEVNKNHDYPGVNGNYVDLIGDAGPLFEEAVGYLMDDGGGHAAGVNPIYKPKASEAHRVRVKLNPGMELASMAAKYIKEYAPDELDANHLMELTKKFLEGT